VLDKEASLRIQCLRFPLIVGVVFIHGYYSSAQVGGSTVGLAAPGASVEFIRNLCSQCIARVAVPFFFLFSGYFFFLGLEGDRASYVRRWKARVRTLLIPYLFWNLAVLAIAAIGQSLPAWQSSFSGGNTPRFSEFGPWDYVKALFGIDRLPVAYQFWFICDLMVLVLLTPVIGFLVRRVGYVWLALTTLCWTFELWPVRVPSQEATLYFSIGAWAASKELSLFAFDRYGKLLLLVWLPLVVLDSLPVEVPLRPYIHKLAVAIGVVCSLYLSRFLAASARWRALAVSLAAAAFFTFAVHEPLLTVMRKVVFKLLTPDSSTMLIFLYFAVPLAVIGFAVAGFAVARRIAPGFVSAVTGGRAA